MVTSCICRVEYVSKKQKTAKAKKLRQSGDLTGKRPMVHAQTDP